MIIFIVACFCGYIIKALKHNVLTMSFWLQLWQYCETSGNVGITRNF